MLRLPARALFVLTSLSCAAHPPDRDAALYVGAGMAGRNNPHHPDSDEDNLTLVAGGRVPVGVLTLRPEVHSGDFAVLYTPALTFDWALAGEGLGSLDAHIGLGVSFLSERRNSVLGNTSSVFARAGIEGNLTHGILVGAALLVAPFGYDHDDLALAGIAYAGVKF